MKNYFNNLFNSSVFRHVQRLAVVCVFLSISVAAAATHDKHYSKATVSANPTGGGIVYVAASTTKPDTPTSSAMQNCNEESSKDNQKYYFWAVANPNYTFLDFKKEGDNTSYTKVSGQEISVGATSTGENSPTLLEVTANFSPILTCENIAMYKMPDGSLSTGVADVTLNNTTDWTVECSRTDLFDVTYSARPTGGTNEKITISVKKTSTAGDIPSGIAATITLTPTNSDLSQAAYNPTQKSINIIISEPSIVTFNPAIEGGYYTYQQTSIEEPFVEVKTQKTIGIVDAQEGVVELKAYPSTGYRFRRWVIMREAADPEYLYEATVTPNRFSSDATVTAEFVDTTCAQFIVLGTDTAKYKYAHLEDAIAVAQNQGKSVVAVYVPGRLKVTSTTTKNSGMSALLNPYTFTINSIACEGNTEWVLPKPTSGIYTIPAGITFLVPGLDKKSIQELINNETARSNYVSYHTITYRYNTSVGVNEDFLETNPTPVCICKLSVEDGTKIEVNGAISVYSAPSTTQGYTGRPTGYGQIHLGENSTIKVNEGGILHVLGYVTGKDLNSTVTAKKGATIYEAFQFTDWRGGTATMAGFNDFIKKEVFPVGQYYMQSIETKLILEYGSKELLIAAVDVLSPFPVTPGFTDTISETITSSGAIEEKNLGLFLLGEDTRIEKYYDFAKDSLYIKIVGESNTSRAKLNYMYMDVSASVGDYSLDSRKYILPVNHNIAMTIDNVQVECPYKFAFMPGSRLELTPTAHLKIQNKVYVYDAELNVRPSDSTIGYCGSVNAPIMPITYTSQGKPTARTAEKLRYPIKMKDATFVIDGTLTMADARIVMDAKEVAIQGMLHTTTDATTVTGIEGDSVKIKEDFGAKITSNGNGVINFNRLGTTDPVNQIKQNNTSIDGYESIPVCNAWLRNSDETRTGGTTAAVGDTYVYIDGFWKKPTATLTNPQGTNFVVTLPNEITHEVVCDEVGNNATITNVEKTSIEGDSFFTVGDVKREGGKVKILVTYTPNGVHNADGTPNQGKIHLSVTYKDQLEISHTTSVEIDLTGTENYQPAFSVAINGTPMQNGDTYPTIQGIGVGETKPLPVEITPNPNNITTTDRVSWIDAANATAAPFSFAYGENDAFLSAASLFYTPTEVSDNHSGTLTIMASYPNGGTPVDSTIVIYLSAKVNYKPNKLQFATFPTPVYETTDPFLLLDETTNNAKTDITYELSPAGIVEIIGTGTAADPYMVKPLAEGVTTITVNQIASSSIEAAEISTQINVTRDDYVLQSVPFCIDNNTVFNTHLYSTSGVTYNATNSPYTIDFNSTSAVSTWQFQFLGMPDKLTFTPSGVNAWRIREGKPVTVGTEPTIEWNVVTEWTNLTSGTSVSYTLQPTTRYVEISYGAATSDIGKIVGDVCVSALTIRTKADKLYMPIYYTTDKVAEDSVVFTHTSASAPAISISGINASVNAPKKLGADEEAYYETTVVLQSPATTAEGTYTLTATQNTNSAGVNITTYKFPQELPIKLATDKPDNGDRYHFVTTTSRYAQWNATKRQIIFQNPGAQVARSVTFAFNGAPSIVTFDVSSAEGAQTIINSDWTIYESKDGKDFQPASLAKRDSIEDNILVQELNYTTRYVRVEYNAQSTREVYLSNLVIEGYPQAIVYPGNLFFTSEETKKSLYMIAINLQKVDFEIDNATAFQMTTDTTLTATDWRSIINATELTHSTALGLNKVDTIFLAVRWSQQTALDEGKITIKNKTSDSILAIIPLMGSDNYLTIDKADNTGISTGIPTGYTYHGSEYTAYKHHEVKLTNAFAADGTALFDYLFIYDETTPAEGADITAPRTGSADGSTNIGSNAVTPLVVYKKALNADKQYKGYQFVGKVDNVNVSNKAVVGDVIIKDTADVVHINVQDTALRVYMTGFCPYATTGYTKNQEGVFLFRGTHGAKLDVYLEDFHVSSRNKTQNGNGFYGDKEGGETYSEGYARGSGGVLVFENVDAQEQLQNFTPFEISIHTIGDDNLLNSNHGCFFALKVGEATAMKAYQVSSPIQVHMLTKEHVRKTKTTLNFDDIWPTAVNANNEITDSIRTNGFLALKKQANNAPSIDMGNPYTEVNFKGGQIELQNSQIGSDTYKTTLAISYRAGFFGAEEAGIKLCHGIGTDAVDGTVNFLDGTVTVERMKVAEAYRQYYLMDTLADGTESEYTTCLRTPKNTYVRGGSICRVRACQSVTSKGGGPKDKNTGSLLGQYVYTMQPGDELHTNNLVKSITFPANISGLVEYQTSRDYTYGLQSVTPDVNNNLYFWIPEGYGGVTAEKDVFMATWKACMTKIGAGLAGVAEGEVGGDTEISSEEEVQNFLYCQLDDNIYDVISAGTTDAEGNKTYTYQAPIEVPAAAKGYFKGEYTRWAPNLVGNQKQHEVISNTTYTILNRVYYITTATADIWQTFTAPFDVANIYVVEAYSEEELEKVGTRAEILKEQAKHNADFAAFFGVAMAMGSMKDFNGIYDSYIKWAKIQDDSLGLYTLGDDNYTLRGKTKLVPYFGNNWRDANFYLNVNKGNWVISDDTFGFKSKWEMLSQNDTIDGILLHKDSIYSLMFPYCTGCVDENGNRDFWDYWSGKFLIFESVAAPQTIKGRDFLNDSIFAYLPENNDSIVVSGNSTFARLETARENVYSYYLGEENEYGAEGFLPKENDEDVLVVQPTTAFLYGDVPSSPEGMPAKRVTRDGRIIYGDSNNGNQNGTSGGHMPTVGGGNDLFVTSIAGGINVAVAAPQNVRVLSSTGAVIYSGYIQTAVDIKLPTNGIYIVSGENEVQKILY